MVSATFTPGQVDLVALTKALKESGAINITKRIYQNSSLFVRPIQLSCEWEGLNQAEQNEKLASIIYDVHFENINKELDKLEHDLKND